MFAKTMPQTLKTIITGTKSEKKHAIHSLMIWFAAGGLVFSAFGSYIDKIIPGDINTPLYAICAGLLTAIVSTIKATY